MILEAVVTYQDYLNGTHCTLKMTIEFDFSSYCAAATCEGWVGGRNPHLTPKI